MISSSSRPEDVAWGPSGLVPAVVQDVADGRVLMVAYLDAEALAATLATGEVHFHSRSRDRLWRKGETSGNVLRLRNLAIDCDGDALLISVDPVGPTCHRGTRSCFDAADTADAASSAAAATAAATARQGFEWLETLWAAAGGRGHRVNGHDRLAIGSRSGHFVHGTASGVGRGRPCEKGRGRGDRGAHGSQG